jgi:hypothetical protein
MMVTRGSVWSAVEGCEHVEDGSLGEGVEGGVSLCIASMVERIGYAEFSEI